MALVLNQSMAAEDNQDTYLYRDTCPQLSNKTDKWNFTTCNCTSYVADQLNELWSQKPFFSNQYYGVAKWGDARFWKNVAIKSRIGVTGATDNFTWNESSYNAVFFGDVVWWDSWVVKKPNGTIDTLKSNPYGHVAFAENATPATAGKGVSCVTVSEYNFNPPYDYKQRRICKGDGQRFPDAFIHIDQDHIYCLQHPENCPNFNGTGSGGLAGGKGGGSDPFNLIINNFTVVDSSGTVLTDGMNYLKSNQIITAKVQLKAVDGSLSKHMRAGKTKIEVDIYVRRGNGDWIFLVRAYTKGTSLGNGTTHTESASYTVSGMDVSDVSFKAKIDAEDEAFESNEGDNWSETKTFTVTGSSAANFTPPNSLTLQQQSAVTTVITNYLLDNK